MRGEHSSHPESTTINNCHTPGSGPTVAPLSTLTLTLHPALSCHFPQRSDAGKGHHSAQRSLTNGDLPGFSEIYPIFHPFPPGESRELCAEYSSIRHTFGKRRSSMRLIVNNILRLEPRALSPATVRRVHHSSSG